MRIVRQGPPPELSAFQAPEQPQHKVLTATPDELFDWHLTLFGSLIKLEGVDDSKAAE